MPHHKTYYALQSNTQPQYPALSQDLTGTNIRNDQLLVVLALGNDVRLMLGLIFIRLRIGLLLPALVHTTPGSPKVTCRDVHAYSLFKKPAVPS